MVQFLTTPAASVVLLLALTAVLIAVGVYVIGKVRRDLTSDAAGANELLSNFKEMHSRGGLDDEEYRTIKAMLAKRLERELGAGVTAASKAKADAEFKTDRNTGQDESG
jgi:beta-xylosidase